jgi:hypothetical protein
MPEVGDVATVSLTVAPYDGTTAATLTVTAPNGTVTTPATGTADGGQTWTATLTYTLAGVWRLKWTVTGAGASVEGQKIAVAPAPDAALGRSYATSTDLANYLGAAPPVDADRLLAEATTLLDSRVLRLCWYVVGDDGLPTDPLVISALSRAVCAQARWWDELGGSTTGADSAGWSSVSLGSLSLSRSGGSTSGSDSPAQQIAPGVWDELMALNLTCNNFTLGAVASC